MNDNLIIIKTEEIETEKKMEVILSQKIFMNLNLKLLYQLEIIIINIQCQQSTFK